MSKKPVMTGHQGAHKVGKTELFHTPTAHAAKIIAAGGSKVTKETNFSQGGNFTIPGSLGSSHGNQLGKGY